MIIKKKFNRSVVFATTVKNAAGYISNFIKIVSDLSKIYKDYYIIIVEADSQDNTINMIKKITKNYKCKLLCLNTKKIKFRTSRLSIARNKILEVIKKDKNLNKFDDLILLDSDKVNRLITSNKIFESISAAPKDWVGIFPNQKIFYYDLWGLRIKQYYNFDCFNELKKYAKKIKPSYAYYKVIFKNFFLINSFKKRFIEVDSAWGGMGIYKLKYAIKSKYNSNRGRNNEIVFFNKTISMHKKKLYIDKKLINSYGFNDHIIKGFIYILSNYYAKKLLVDKFK
jgi:hypothetical protein